MADLADDIARIAALRGKPAADYLDRPARRAISDASVRMIFHPHEFFRDDLRAFDRLPARSRRFLRELPLCPNAMAYAGTLGPGEDTLIEAVTALLPEIVRERVIRTYGSNHPQARRWANG